MPADLGGDEIGAPVLCDHHRAVIANLAEKDHVDDRDSTRAATEMNRQCCQTRRTP